MPLPPTYSTSHHHIFSRINDRCLASHHHVLAVYPSNTTPLQSANHQLAFDYDSDSTADQQCHSTIFLSVLIPNSFHSTIAIYFQHGIPIYFRHGTTIVDKSNQSQQIHFQQIISNKPIFNNHNFSSFLCLVFEFPSCFKLSFQLFSERM